MNLQGNIVNINPATEKLLGCSVEKFKKTAIQSFILEKYQSHHHDCFEKVLQGELQNFDTAVYDENGQIIHLNLTYLPIMLEQQVIGIYSIGKDITAQKTAQELNAYWANHDELTKLLNRRGFEVKLKDAISNARRSNQKLSIMYIDLDRFKNINDTGPFCG